MMFMTPLCILSRSEIPRLAKVSALMEGSSNDDEIAVGQVTVGQSNDLK
jgi:hypothetical protein